MDPAISAVALGATDVVRATKKFYPGGLGPLTDPDGFVWGAAA